MKTRLYTKIGILRIEVLEIEILVDNIKRAGIHLGESYSQEYHTDFL